MLLVQGLLEEPAPRVYRHSRGSGVFRADAMRDYYRLGSWSVPSWWRVGEVSHTPGVLPLGLFPHEPPPATLCLFGCPGLSGRGFGNRLRGPPRPGNC